MKLLFEGKQCTGGSRSICDVNENACNVDTLVFEKYKCNKPVVLLQR